MVVFGKLFFEIVLEVFGIVDYKQFEVKDCD